MLSIVIAIVAAQSTPDAGVEDEVDRQRVTVVTGTRTERRAADVVVPTEVITRTQIEQLGVRDLPRLLQQHPGVEMVYTNRGTGIRLQGSTPSTRRSSSMASASRAPGRSPTSRASACVRSSASRSSRAGGRAVRRRRDGRGDQPHHPPAAEAVVEGAVRGMFGTLLEGDVRGNIGSKLGPFELRAGGGYRTRQPFDWIPADPETSGAGLRRIDADAEVAFVPDASLRAWVRSAYVFTDYDAVDINDTQVVFDCFQRTEQFDVWLGVRKTFSPNTSADAARYFGLFKDQFLVDQRGSRRSTSTRSTSRAWKPSARSITASSGTPSPAASRAFRSCSRRRATTRPRCSAGASASSFRTSGCSTARSASRSPRPSRRHRPAVRLGAVAAHRDEGRPAAAAHLPRGVGPRLPAAVVRRAVPAVLNAGIGYIVKGNPKLQAERSGSVNVSLDYRLPWDGWVISGSAWHTSLTNLINITANGLPNPDDPVTFGYENVTDAYTQGVELSARMKLSRCTYLDLGYMGLDARDVSRNRPLEGRSNHRVNATVTTKYRPLGLEFVARATFHSERPFYLGTGLGFANVLGLR